MTTWSGTEISRSGPSEIFSYDVRLVKKAKDPEARDAVIRLFKKVRNTYPPWIREDHTPEDVIRLYRQRADWLGISYEKRKKK